MMKENKNKNTFQFFKQRLDEAIGRFALDSQDQPDGGHDFFLNNLNNYSRFDWINNDDGIETEKSDFTAHIDDQAQLFLTIQNGSKEEPAYYVTLSIKSYNSKYSYRDQQKVETIARKRIATADKIATIFIRNIDEFVKRHFQSKAADVGQMRPREQSMKKDTIGFDQ